MHGTNSVYVPAGSNGISGTVQEIMKPNIMDVGYRNCAGPVIQINLSTSMCVLIF